MPLPVTARLNFLRKQTRFGCNSFLRATIAPLISSVSRQAIRSCWGDGSVCCSSLLETSGDIERNPGPSRTCQPRGDLDLSVGFCKITANRMSKCLGAFARWLDVELQLNFDTVADAQHTALALRAYGMHLYKHGFPRYLFVYAVTAIQDQYPQHRPFLSGAWHIDRKWQIAEPGRCRTVLSLPMFRAALCLSLLLSWPRWTAVTMLAFSGMLHSAEFIQLTRRDLMLP